MRRSGLVATFVLVLVAGCQPTPPPVHTDLVTVSKIARITIPTSATSVFCRTDRDEQSSFSLPQLDFHYWGRFDIPVADLPLFLQQLPKDCQPKPFSGYSNVTSHQTAEVWWHPERIRNPQEVGWMMPGFAVSLLFGPSEVEGVLTVYFFNHEL